PVARSPSRIHYWTRWWALTPPFHPSPGYTGGSTLCCGCSRPSVTRWPPPLPVSWGNLSTSQPLSAPSRQKGSLEIERESGSSSADSSTGSDSLYPLLIALSVDRLNGSRRHCGLSQT